MLGVLADFGVNLLVKFFHGLDLSTGKSLLPERELPLEGIGVLLLQQVVVLLDVTTEDVLSVDLGIVNVLGLLSFNNLTTLVLLDLSLLNSETGESLSVVRDVETTVTCTLHSSENSVTGGGSDKTNIQ